MLDQHFLYFPTRELIGSPADYGIAFEDVYFDTADGRRLHGWYVPGDGDVTLLWHHGNGGNISHRLPDIDLFHRELGVNILIYDYRGYGNSAGTPSEEGLYRDAEAALRHLQSREDVDPAKIVYFGRSLGVAIAPWSSPCDTAPPLRPHPGVRLPLHRPTWRMWTARGSPPSSSTASSRPATTVEAR